MPSLAGQTGGRRIGRPPGQVLVPGLPGKYVPIAETIRGFKMIVEGEMDAYPENAFFNVGTIDEVIQKAKQEEV